MESVDVQDTNARIDGSHRASYTWAWLLAALAVAPFANGRDCIGLAAFLFPAFLMRFVRDQRSRWGLLAAYAVLVVGVLVDERGMIPIPQPIFSIFIVVGCALNLLPYWLDRWAWRRLPRWAGTLVFPVAVVTLQFLVSFGPHGSWGSTAYTQSGNLALLQVLSVAGVAGVTFLVTWFAGAANLAWEQRLATRASRRMALLYAAVYAGVILAGGARLAWSANHPHEVRVAALAVDTTTPRMSDALYGAAISGKADAEQWTQFSAAAAATDNDLLARTRREAQAGAKLVFWAEGSAPVLQPQEAQLITRAGELARAEHIYLGMAMSTVTPGAPKTLQNKVILLRPDGRVAWQYYKAKLTPGPESASAVRGNGILKLEQTPLGRLTTAICFDADFPRLLRQSGEMDAGLVMVPASDWRAIDPWHAMMARYRAIEDGVNLVRATHRGLSGAWDAHGRLLAAADYYGATDHTLVAEVPTQGVWTLYAHTGDWFAWLCLLTLGGLTGMAWRDRSQCPSAGN